VREPDATFSDPRQAVLYDVFNNDRSDLDAYVRIADEVEAHRVVDVGCGTGSLAVRLAELGFSVTGVDPAGVSLDVARTKPNAELVTWVHGDATSLVGLEAAAETRLSSLGSSWSWRHHKSQFTGVSGSLETLASAGELRLSTANQG
jgi:SAM-dependent methyltransferase